MQHDDIIKTRAKAAADLFRAHLVRDLQASILANERALERFGRVLLGHGFIVQNGHGNSITFDASADGLAVNPHMTTPGAAMRFTENKARELAAVTHDGTGLPFKAVHVIDALKRQIQADRLMLAELAGLEPSRAPALVKEDDDL
jgi:hypothetical protein